MYFSSNLSHLRRKQNLTQDAIAGEIGLSRQSIAFWFFPELVDFPFSFKPQ